MDSATATAGSATFNSSGGAWIFEQWWRPAGEPRGVVAICHGYAEHSGRYAEVAAYLNGRGYAVEALDLRGHGRSSGERVMVERFDDFLDDLDGFLARVRGRNAGRKLFLVGHSMGGGVVTGYVVARKPRLDGVLLSGAAMLQAPPERPAGAEPPPSQPLPASAISRDPAVVAAYESDPLVYRGAPKAAMFGAFGAAVALIQGGMEGITLPLLIMHGTADLLVPTAGSEALYGRAGSADKTLKLYEGLYHEILNEPERLEVLGDIAGWLDARTG